MNELGWQAWVAIGGIAAAAGLAMLHALAMAVRVERHIHDTQLKAATLRRAYAEQMAAIEAARSLNNKVEIVGQGSMDQARAA